MLRSERRSKKSNKGTPWKPRGDKLIPGHKVEDQKKGKGSYKRAKEKFKWNSLYKSKYD